MGKESILYDTHWVFTSKYSSGFWTILLLDYCPSILQELFESRCDQGILFVGRKGFTRRTHSRHTAQAPVLTFPANLVLVCFYNGSPARNMTLLQVIHWHSPVRRRFSQSQIQPDSRSRDFWLRKRKSTWRRIVFHAQVITSHHTVEFLFYLCRNFPFLLYSSYRCLFLPSVNNKSFDCT